MSYLPPWLVVMKPVHQACWQVRRLTPISLVSPIRLLPLCLLSNQLYRCTLKSKIFLFNDDRDSGKVNPDLVPVLVPVLIPDHNLPLISIDLAIRIRLPPVFLNLHLLQVLHSLPLLNPRLFSRIPPRPT